MVLLFMLLAGAISCFYVEPFGDLYFLIVSLSGLLAATIKLFYDDASWTHKCFLYSTADSFTTVVREYFNDKKKYDPMEAYDYDNEPLRKPKKKLFSWMDEW